LVRKKYLYSKQKLLSQLLFFLFNSPYTERSEGWRNLTMFYEETFGTARNISYLTTCKIQGWFLEENLHPRIYAKCSNTRED